jgi:hypothetical protein
MGRDAPQQRRRHSAAPPRAEDDERSLFLLTQLHDALRRVPDRRAKSNVGPKSGLACELRKQGLRVAHLLFPETLLARGRRAHSWSLGRRLDVKPDELEPQPRGQAVRHGQCAPRTFGVVQTANDRAHEQRRYPGCIV